MFGKKKEEKTIFDDLPGEETTFQKARREAREAARHEHEREKQAALAHLGGMAGRTEANVTEGVGSRVLRRFAPEDGQKPRPKGFLGAFRDFSKRVHSNLDERGKDGVLRKDSPLLREGGVNPRSPMGQLYGGGGQGGGSRPKVKKVKVITYE